MKLVRGANGNWEYQYVADENEIANKQQQLLDAYKGLITSQHRGKPKYMSTVEALLKFGEDIYATGVYMDEEFDLDIAAGAQEDVLGVLVGASRELGFQPHTQDTAVLNDEDYRILLKAKVAKNLWKGGIADLQTIWYNLFGEDIVIIDYQDMSIEVEIRNVPSSVVQENILQGYIVPKPQSVGMNYHLIRELDSQYWIGGAPSTHTKAVIRMEYAKGGEIDATIYYGAEPSTHHKTVVGMARPEGGNIDTRIYLGAEPSTHRRTTVGMARPEGGAIGARVYIGAQLSRHLKYQVSQPVSSGGMAGATQYYGARGSVHKKNMVWSQRADGGRASALSYYAALQSVHKSHSIYSPSS